VNRRGVLAALLLFLTLATGSAMLVRPLQPADEPLNVDYAVALSDGRLPRADEPVRPVMPGQRPVRPQFVANHPPGYYAVVSVPVSAGVAAGRPWDGVLAGRLLTVLLSAPVVLLVAGLARALTRRRRQDVAVAAAGIAAAWWALPLHAGLIHNDGPATTIAAGQLLLAVLLLRDGLRWRWAAGLVALSAAASLVRLSASTLIGLCAVALVASALLHRRTTRARAALVGGAWALALAAACAATSGWWWLRNVRLYGDVTGTPLIVRLLGWEPDPRSLPEIAADVSVWRSMAWASVGGAQQEAGRAAVTTWWVTVAVVIGVAVLLLLRTSRARAASWGWPEAAIVTFLSVHVAATLAQVVVHVQHGGGAHPRYLFPVMPVLAVVVAVALLRIRGGWALLAVLVSTQAIGAGVFVDRFVTADGGWTRGAWTTGVITGTVALGAVLALASAARAEQRARRSERLEPADPAELVLT
jgi:hypothetical protein